MGMAFQHIRNGKPLIESQLDSGFESGNGFRDAFTRVMGTVPKRKDQVRLFTAKWIETKLGSMVAIADDHALFLLEFVDRRGLETEIEKMRKKFSAAIIPGSNEVLEQLEEELALYFEGKRMTFKTPISMELGSDFQREVWALLREIQPGETISYKDLAIQKGNPNAFRAVARANGANQISILIPCHRVINTNGELGGYGGGIHRKDWLLQLEKKMRDE
ncbi:MAG: methylated-DNA--[protein]-cysteine S-methyltransferase, partial [Kurthia sp.]